jgi:tetratricopeptide (TPR) repeat protein
MALILHQQKHQWGINELEQRVTQALDEKVVDMQNDQYVTRRGALSFIAGIPLALYGFAKISGQSSTSLVPEEVIPLYTAGIPACWRLYYESGQSELECVLPTYLSHLTILAQAPSKHQKSAAGLLSQSYQLMALIAQRHENFGRAIEHCKQAAMYGQLAGDADLQAMALIRQQDTCFERKRFTQWFQLLKDAESFSENITPLLRGRIYARLSHAYTYQGQPTLAQRYMDLARGVFPDHPETDASFLYNHTTHFVLFANQALMYMKLGHLDKAWEAITKAGEFVAGPTNPRKIDVTQYQIQVAIELHDLELSCSLFETLVGYTKQFGQELDVGKTHEVYQQLHTHWLHEKRVHALREHLLA